MQLPTAWRLTFPDKSLEQAYRNRYWLLWVPYARVGMLSAAALGAAFSLLDHLVVGYAVRPLSLIRFGILVPTIIVGFLLSFVETCALRYHIVVIVCVVCVGLCIISMIAIIDPPAADYYYAGLIMVLFFNYTLLQLRLTHAIASGFTLVVLYEILAACVLESPSDAIINNTFFIVSTTYGGVFACYTIERSRRKNFEQFMIIESESRDLQTMADRLQEISCRDEMTGLLNRRRLKDSFRFAAELCREVGGNSALMLIDVDNFKEINDRFGHDTGDDVLVGVARSIRETIGGQGSAFRYGGDEFLVLLPGVTAVGAGAVACQIRRQIRQSAELTDRDCSSRVSVSIGITEVASSRDTFRTVMRAADAALYRAKASGKGRTVVQPRLDAAIGRESQQARSDIFHNRTEGELGQSDPG